MMRIGSLCSGYEGLGLAVHQVLGGEVAWVADNDPDAAAILSHRFPGVPNLGDITITDWSSVEPVTILVAGFPCTDVSCAGARAGLRAGTRSGVWSHVAEAIGVLRPALVFLENVRGLHSAAADSNMEPCPWCLGDSGDKHPLRASGAVLGDLADLGFDAEWVTFPASGIGAPHRRERVFILAWPAEDSNGATSCQRRLAAPGQAAGGRPRADAGRSGGACAPDFQSRAAADTEGDRHGHSRPQGQRRIPAAPVTGAPANPCRSRLSEHPAEPSAEETRTLPGDEPAGDRGLRADTGWGPYEPAIRRWERVTGRPAPRPTEPGRTGDRLSPFLVEWMMGLPEGWVTGVPGLSRNAMLKALGNGVVPQQAALALTLLLAQAGFAEAREAA